MINSFFENTYHSQINDVIKTILQSLEKFPESLLPEIKNMPMYIEFLETLKNILSFFNFIFKKNFTDELINNIDLILGVQVKILKNTPQHGVSIRKEVIHMIKYEITEIANMEKQDKQVGNRGRDHLYLKKNQCL